MAHLSRADLEAVLACVSELGTAAPQRERADAWLLDCISHMIGREFAAYTYHDELSRRLMGDAEYPAESAAEPRVATDYEWRLIKRENPFCQYVRRTGDRYFLARRTTDIVDMRAFRRTEFFEVFDIAAMPHAIQMRLPSESERHWTLEMGRSASDFSKRDVLVLNALRPALIEYESYRRLVAAVTELQSSNAASPEVTALTLRENEVLDLVAAGATNAAIAERMWISPGTVRKHLEHVYRKLEVGSRTAALARTGRSSVASGSHDI